MICMEWFSECGGNIFLNIGVLFFNYCKFELLIKVFDGKSCVSRSCVAVGLC